MKMKVSCLFKFLFLKKLEKENKKAIKEGHPMDPESLDNTLKLSSKLRK